MKSLLKARILVIDDDPTVRTALSLALGNAGYETMLAADGKEGMIKHRANEADLIIIDLFMPGQEGIETILALRKQFPGLPILAISGDGLGSPGMLAMAKELGAGQILQKPFDTETLLFTVQKSLGGQG